MDGRGDRIAFRGMAGMIGEEEIHRQKRSFANIGNTHAFGYKFNKEDCKQRSERLRGNKFSLGLKRGPWTEERKKQKSQSMLGNKHAVGNMGWKQRKTGGLP